MKLRKFPSKKPKRELNTSSVEYFRSAYDDVMYSGIVGFYSRMTHRIMERPFRGRNYKRVLEVGAGQGQHFNFVQCNIEEYLESDLDSELKIYSRNNENVSRYERITLDAQNLDCFSDESFDRVIATCLLAHLDFPENALLEWKRVTKVGGVITIYVPTEPGMLLRLTRGVVMVPKSKKFGQDHLAVVYRDHRNHYPMMRTLIEVVFSGNQIKRKRFPLPFLGWNFNFFEIFQITKLNCPPDSFSH